MLLVVAGFEDVCDMSNEHFWVGVVVACGGSV